MIMIEIMIMIMIKIMIEIMIMIKIMIEIMCQSIIKTTAHSLVVRNWNVASVNCGESRV